MNPLLAALALAASAAPPPAAALPEPIAQASRGRLQCHSPDPARKTCLSLASYRLGAGGAIESTAVALVSAEPPVTMETVTPVEVRDGQVCGTLRTRDLDAATFRSGGKPLPAARAAPLRKQLKAAMKAVFGKRVCTAYVPEGEALLAKATVDGTPQPAMTQKVLWVSPEDGFRVAP